MELFQAVSILALFALSFIATVAWTPALTHVLYKYKLGKSIRNDLEKTPVFSKLHAKKEGTPTMGGVLIWGTTAVFAGIFALFAVWFPDTLFADMQFLSRSETLLPLGVLVASALVGLVDDFFNIRKMGPNGGGLKMSHRLFIFTAIAVGAALWFFFKLDWTIVYIPQIGNVDIGMWTIPLFILVIVATAFSVNETDGLDGLAGGTLLTAFVSYAVIAFVLGRFDLAAFCAVICGALLAFLWFNIPPARFFMGDTGSMSLGVTLGVVAMLTNTVWVLPIIGCVLVVESLSVIIQVTSKKLRSGKKVFHSAPIHHHFEAIGWEESKIVMRSWIISAVAGVLAIVLFLLDRSVL